MIYLLPIVQYSNVYGNIKAGIIVKTDNLATRRTNDSLVFLICAEMVTSQ